MFPASEFSGLKSAQKPLGVGARGVCAQLSKGGRSGYRYSSAKSGYISANLLKSAGKTRLVVTGTLGAGAWSLWPFPGSARGPHPLWQAWTEGNDLGGEKRNGHPTPFFSAAPKITEKQGGGDCILSTIPLWEFKESVIVSSVVHSGNSVRVREAPLITGSAQDRTGHHVVTDTVRHVMAMG